jgi:glycine hydroxymethyltransferase
MLEPMPTTQGRPAAADPAAMAAITGWYEQALAALARDDPGIVDLAAAELTRRRRYVNLVAASSPTLPAALAAQSLLFSSVTSEGYVGARYHPGAEVVDAVETLARQRAERLMRSPHANVQPSSGSAANLAVLYGVIDAGDTILSLDLVHGGHLSHGARVASISKHVPTSHYGVTDGGGVDPGMLADVVKECRPRVVICGGSAYPRAIDFTAFRAAADEVDALLLADISHVSGLVAARVHPSPVPLCDAVTTSTYKQLCGPRGGLVLLGEDSRLGASDLDRAVFPGFQGTCDFGTIAAKAVALGFASTDAFAAAMRRVTRFARAFADALEARGTTLVGGGTDTHMVLVDLRGTAVSGRVVADVLEHCGVLVNKNMVPGDERSPMQTSGVRLGTNDLGFRVLDDALVAALAAAVAAAVGDLAGGVAPADVAGRAELAGVAADVAACRYVPELCPQ